MQKTIDQIEILDSIYSKVELDLTAEIRKKHRESNGVWLPTRKEIYDIISNTYLTLKQDPKINEHINSLFLKKENEGFGKRIFEILMFYNYQIQKNKNRGFKNKKELEQIKKDETKLALNRFLRLSNFSRNPKPFQNLIDLIVLWGFDSKQETVEEILEEIFGENHITKGIIPKKVTPLEQKELNHASTIFKEFGQKGIEAFILKTMEENNAIEKLIELKTQLDKLTNNKGLNFIIQTISSNYGVINANKVAKNMVFSLTGREELTSELKKIIFISSLKTFGIEKTIPNLKSLEIQTTDAFQWLVSSLKINNLNVETNKGKTIMFLKKKNAIEYLWKQQGINGLIFALDSLSKFETSKEEAFKEFLELSKDINGYSLKFVFEIVKETWDLNTALKLFILNGLEKQGYKYFELYSKRLGKTIDEITSNFFNIMEDPKLAFEIMATNNRHVFGFNELVKRVGFEKAYFISQEVLQDRRITNILAREAGFGTDVFLLLKNEIGLTNTLTQLSKNDTFGIKDTIKYALDADYIHSSIEFLKKGNQNEIIELLNEKGNEGYQILTRYWGLKTWENKINELSSKHLVNLFSYLETEIKPEEYTILFKGILEKNNSKKILEVLAKEINWTKKYSNKKDFELHENKLKRTVEIYKILTEESSELTAFKTLHSIVKSEYGLYEIRKNSGFEKEAIERLIRIKGKKAFGYLYKTSDNTEQFLTNMKKYGYLKEAFIELRNNNKTEDVVNTSINLFGKNETLKISEETGIAYITYSEISKKEGAISAFQTAMKSFNSIEKAFYLATLNNEVPIIFDTLGTDLGYTEAIKICTKELGSIKRVINYSLEGHFNYSNKEIEIPKEILKTRIENLINAYYEAGYGKEFLREIKTKKYLGSKKDTIKIAIEMLGEDKGIRLAANSLNEKENNFTEELMKALIEIPKTREKLKEITRQIETNKPLDNNRQPTNGPKQEWREDPRVLPNFGR